MIAGMKRQSHGVQHKPGRHPGQPQSHTPKVAQRAMATPSQVRKPPVAPPAYRPQPTPKVLQAKVTITSQPATQPGRAPVAPPVYRPQPVPKVLQTKVAATARQPVNQTGRAPVTHPAPSPRQAPGDVPQKTGTTHPPTPQARRQVQPTSARSAIIQRWEWPWVRAPNPTPAPWKTGLEKQKVKGNRDWSGKSTGLTLTTSTPGSRSWPSDMTGAHNATNQRNAVPLASGVMPTGQSAWGHQLAMQWGGPATAENSAAATNDTGAHPAQEEYQTIVEDAVNDVVAHHGVNLGDIRIKHTAYMYPGTRVAKNMRIKVYVKVGTDWVKAIDQNTQDDAPFLAGGSSNPGSPRGALHQQFVNDILNTMTGATAPLASKHGTSNNEVLSSTMSGGGSWCFITTACVEARRLPDDCEELTLLRAFRDGFMQSQPGGEKLIQEYYRIAPRIVSKIQESDSCIAVLERLYQELVLRSVGLIRQGRNEEALEIYCAHVRQLSAEYLDDDPGGIGTDSSALFTLECEPAFEDQMGVALVS